MSKEGEKDHQLTNHVRDSLSEKKIAQSFLCHSAREFSRRNNITCVSQDINLRYDMSTNVSPPIDFDILMPSTVQWEWTRSRGGRGRSRLRRIAGQ